MPVKSVAQRTLVALHRIRDQWMTTRTARINALRGILREQGLLLPAGAGPALRAIPGILEDAETPLAHSLCHMITLIYEEVQCTLMAPAQSVPVTAPAPDSDPASRASP